MKILSPNERTSERIIRQLTAEILNIPETDAEIEKTAEFDKSSESCDCPKGCSCECKCHKKASSCPECGAEMQKNGNMDRCACGFAQATAGATKKADRKSASETSVVEYYKKIFPDDYVSDLTSEDGCVTPEAGKKVEYGHVPVDKKVSRNKVTAREVLAEGYEGAGDCEVKDSHPESGLGAGSASERVPDPKWQKGDSANSVSGPEKKKEHGPGLKTPGETKSPDLGLPHGAGKWVTREVMAKLCPSCAEDMERRGIKAVSVDFIARTLSESIAKTADSRGLLRRQAGNVCPKCGSGLDETGNCQTCGNQAQTVYAGSKPKNPWAICHTTVDKKKNPEKYERCVKDVKKKM